jgi:oligopeptide transport system ATP-binding protein
MRQRVMIAMALLCRPELLLADEPTTALDVTIQAQILELMKELTRELGTSVILVTHDLGVVAGMAQRVAVMYAGRIVELATTGALFADPRHPYTIGLLRSLPARVDAAAEAARSGKALGPAPGGADQAASGGVAARGPRRLASIPGRPPDLAALPPGCPFVPRCPWAHDRCRQERPPLRGVNGSGVGVSPAGGGAAAGAGAAGAGVPLHESACWLDDPASTPAAQPGLWEVTA